MSDSESARVGYARSVVEGILLDADLRILLPAFVAVFTVREVYGQALPLLFQSVGVPLAVLGVAKSAASAVEVVASPVAGALADEGGRFAVAGAATAVVGLVTAGFLFVGSAVGLTLLVVGFGIATLFVTNSLTPAVQSALDEGVEGIGWGLRDVFLYLGAGVGVAGASYVLERTARPALVLALLCPVSLVVTGVLWRATDDWSLRAVWSALDRDAFSGFALRERLRSVSDRRLLAQFCVVEACTTLGAGMSLYLLPAFATELDFAGSVYLLVYAGTQFVGVPASLLGGALADHVSKKALYVGNFACEAAMLCVFGVAGSRPVFLLGMGLFVVQTTFEPGVLAYFFDNFDDEESGTIWGIKGSVHKATQVAAPTLGGLLYAYRPRYAFLLGGVVMAVGALVAATLPADR